MFRALSSHVSCFSISIFLCDRVLDGKRRSRGASAMARAARHMTREELNQLRLWQSSRGHLSPRELWKLHVKDRKSRQMKSLCLRAFRNVLNGQTYNSCKETRGRKRKLQPRAVEAVNKKRTACVLAAPVCDSASLLAKPLVLLSAAACRRTPLVI